MRNLPHSKIAVFALVFFSALGGLLYGLDIGTTSAAISQLKDPISGVDWYITIANAPFYEGLVASSSLLGAFLSSLFLAVMAHYSYSSRRVLLVGSAFYIIGAFFEMWAYRLGLYTLIMARIIYGFGIGLSMVGCPAYLADMAPQNIRGMALTLKETFVMTGLLIGYGSGSGLVNTNGGWALMYAIGLPISVFMFVGMISIPDSYRWHILQRQQSDAIRSIKFVYPEITNAQVHDILNSIHHDETVLVGNSCVILTTPRTFTSLSLAILLVAFQQFSGQPSVLYYLNSLLTTLQINQYSTVWISALMLITTLIIPWIIDKLGRKYILGVGCIIMLLALLITVTILSNASESQYYNNDLTVVIVCLCFYIVGYEIGFGPIVWLLCAELSPPDTKELVLSITFIVNIFCNFLLTALFPVSVEGMGIANLLFIYAAVIFVFLLFLSTSVIPETKGLTLEEIEHLMVQRWAPSSYAYLDIDEI